MLARKNHQNRFTRHYSSSTSKSCLATSYRHYIFWTRVKVVVRHGMFFITRRLLYYLFLRARGKTGGEELFFFIVRPFVFWHFYIRTRNAIQKNWPFSLACSFVCLYHLHRVVVERRIDVVSPSVVSFREIIKWLVSKILSKLKIKGLSGKAL